VVFDTHRHVSNTTRTLSRWWNERTTDGVLGRDTSPPAETWASATTVPERFAGLALGQAGCAPPSPIVQSEIRGTTSDGIELYALLIAKGPVIRAHDEVKIVWRISAGGPLVSATSPLGTPAKVTFGPVAHGGDEWGIGYVFDEPGCWHLQFRSDNRAHIWLVIEP